MKNISAIIDREITIIESEMLRYGRHAIKTETLKNRVLNHISLESDDEDEQWLKEVGFGQAIQMRLHARGYRSVQIGYFVNLDRCDSIPYLVQMLHNQDADVRDRSAIAAIIKDALKNYDAQVTFDSDGKIYVPITRDELNEMLEADAV